MLKIRLLSNFIRISVCIWTAIMFVAASAMADTYYVDPNGSDQTGDGSKAKPWQTPKHACKKVPANEGHIIHLNAGTYYEKGYFILPEGVTLEGEGVDKTIIKGPGGGTFNRGIVYLKSGKDLIKNGSPVTFEVGGSVLRRQEAVNGNQEIRHLTIDGDNNQAWSGIYVENRNNVKIHNVKVVNCDHAGIKITTKRLAKARNIEIYDFVIKECSEESTNGSFGNLSLRGDLENVKIYNGRIEHFGKTGYGIKGFRSWDDRERKGDYLRNVKIYNLEIEGKPTAPWNNYLAPNFSIEFWNIGSDEVEIYNNKWNNQLSLPQNEPIKGRYSIWVHHNEMDVQEGQAIELGASESIVENNYIKLNSSWCGIGEFNKVGDIRNIKIHNNVVEGLNGALLVYYSKIINLQLYNNTVYADGGSVLQLRTPHSEGSSLTVKNNIFNFSKSSKLFTSKSNAVYPSSFVVENNMIGSMNLNGDGTFKNNFKETPQLNQSGSKPTPYYAPKNNSNVIDKGVNVGLSYTGKGPDLGAFEAGGESKKTPTIIGPTNLKFTIGSPTKLSLSWDDNANDETGYEIQRSTGSSDAFETIGSISANTVTFDDEDIESSQTYYYRVRCFNKDVRSSFSNVVEAYIDPSMYQAPLEPTQLMGGALSNSAVKIRWKDKSDNETGFIVQRSTNSTTWTTVATVASNVTEYIDSNIEPGRNYGYKVQAVNDFGKSALTNETVISTIENLYAAINVNGEELYMDNVVWQNDRGLAGYSNSGYPWVGSADIVPAASAGMTKLLQPFAGGNPIKIDFSDVPANTYDIYLYIYEDNANNAFNVSVNGETVAENVQSGDAGSWQRLHLGTHEISGALAIAAASAGKENVNVSAVEIRMAGSTSECTSDLVPKVSIKGSKAICEGGSVKLEAPGGYQKYQWQNGAATQRLIVTNPGTFSVKVQDMTGCWSKLSVPVEVKLKAPAEAPVITVDGNTTICPEKPVKLTAPDGFAAYAWSDNSTDKALVVNKPGLYRVRGRNADGCWSDYSEPVRISYPSADFKPALQTQTSGVVELCEGSTLELAPNMEFDGYEWSTGETRRSITVSESGSYSVSVKLCESIWSQPSEVVEVATIETPAEPIIADMGDSMAVQNVTKGVKYQWMVNDKPILGATKAYYQPLVDGAYSVAAKSSNGCVSHSNWLSMSEVYVDLVSAYPNPNDGVFNIKIDKPRHSEYEVVVYTVVDRIISDEIIYNHHSESLTHPVNVSQYGKGIYFVKVKGPDFEVVKKVLVN